MYFRCFRLKQQDVKMTCLLTFSLLVLGKTLMFSSQCTKQIEMVPGRQPDGITFSLNIPRDFFGLEQNSKHRCCYCSMTRCATNIYFRRRH